MNKLHCNAPPPGKLKFEIFIHLFKKKIYLLLLLLFTLQDCIGYAIHHHASATDVQFIYL